MTHKDFLTLLSACTTHVYSYNRSVAARGRLNGNREERRAGLLLSPPFAALNSSIFATRFLNSSYWHFSYECLSFCPGCRRKAVQRDQEVGAGVSHCVPSNTIEERVCRAGCKMAGVGAQAGLGRLQEALGVATEGRRTGRRTSFEADGMLDCFGNGHGCDCVLTWITTAPAMTLDAVAGRQLSRAKARSIDRVFLVCRIKGCIAIISLSNHPGFSSPLRRQLDQPSQLTSSSRSSTLSAPLHCMTDHDRHSHLLGYIQQCARL
ncbi:hypothetical protein KCV06_g603, partial [Aureobasidium melanogenum]